MRAFGPILCLFFSLFAVRAHAVAAKDVTTARAVALGSSRAMASGNESVFTNPAAAGTTRHYTAQLDYLHSTAPADTNDGGDAIILSIGDSLSNPSFPTAIAYRYMSLGPGGSDTKGWVTDLAVAMPIGEAFSLGVRGTYLSYKEGSRDLSQFTGDLGGLLRLGIFQVGTVGFNLISVDSPDAARGVAVSAAITDDVTWRLGGDVRWQFGFEEARRSWTVAGEYLLGGILPLRVAYDSDAIRDTTFWSGGSGLIISKFGFDVSYRRDMRSNEGLWAFSLKVFGG